MYFLTEQQRSFLLTLAIFTRGDVSVEYPLQRYKAVEGAARRLLVSELAGMRLIGPDCRDVPLTDRGRAIVEAWLEQRLRGTVPA